MTVHPPFQRWLSNIGLGIHWLSNTPVGYPTDASNALQRVSIEPPLESIIHSPRAELTHLKNQVEHDHEEEERLTKQERDALFVIKQPKPMAFPRNEEKEKWQTFVENAFKGYAIKWVYGDKSIGKSTILRAVIWDLQQKWEKKGSDQQLFYVDLENEDIDRVPYIIQSLEMALKENAVKGIKSCVVFRMLWFCC